MAFAWHRRAIALQLDAVYAKILKIEWIFQVAARKDGVCHQTNYDQVWKGAGIKVVKFEWRLVRRDWQVRQLDARIVMPIKGAAKAHRKQCWLAL